MDKRKNVTKQPNGQVFKMEHMDPDYLSHFIANLTKGNRLLSHCCGYTPVGQVRCDWSPDSNRNKAANLFEMVNDFKPGSFPFVYIDPPDKYYNPHCKEIAKAFPSIKNPSYGNPFAWQYHALDVASIALILQRPLIMTNWQGSSKFQEYFLVRDSRPSARILEIIWK